MTVSPKFMETEKVKQNEKTEEPISIEWARENPWKNNETEINNLQDKETKALVIRKLTELWKRTDETVRILIRN